MATETGAIYEFGPYRLNVAARLLMREHQPVALAPKTFELLLLLVGRAGQALSKQELLTALWPDTFVEEGNLSFQISTLRKALGRGASPWIETVPKHGYRFAVAVTTALAPEFQPETSVRTPAAESRAPSNRGPEVAGDLLTAVEIVPAPSLALLRRTRTGSALALTQSWRGRLIAGVLAVAVAALVTWVWQRAGRPWLYVARNSPAVSELLFKATFNRAMWDEAGIRRGIDYNTRAIALDPNAVEAYGGLSAGWLLLSGNYVSPRDAMPRALAAVEQVLRRNEAAAGAHIGLGMIKLQYDWDFAGADREFARALELEPHNTDGRLFRGWLRMAEGRLADAQADMQRAVQEDPANELNLWSLGLSFYFARQYEAAIEQYRRAIALEPRSYWAHLWLGWAYERQGRVAEAIEEFELTRRLLDTPRVVASLVHAQAAAGRRVEAQATMTSLLEYAKRKYVSPYDLATASAGLGDRTGTLEWLEKAYEERSGRLALSLKIDPTFDSLRGDDRFRDLLTRVGHTR